MESRLDKFSEMAARLAAVSGVVCMLLGTYTSKLDDSLKNLLSILFWIFLGFELFVELFYEIINRGKKSDLEKENDAKHKKTKGYLLKNSNGLSELVFYFQNLILFGILLSICILVLIF